MHHGYEPTVPSREWAKRRWLKSLAPSLKELLDQRGNESLILVAAPRMLSQLRLCLPSALRKRIRMEVPRDLAGQTAPSISARLRPTLSSLLRTVRVPDWRRVTGVSSGRTVRHH